MAGEGQGVGLCRRYPFQPSRPLPFTSFIALKKNSPPPSAAFTPWGLNPELFGYEGRSG